MNRARHGSGDDAGLSHFGHFIEREHAAEDVGRERRSGPKRRPAKITKPEKILQSFNTWAFKREQPDNAEAMLRTIADAVKNNRPIQFVLYWGKGPRSCLDTPDIACLDYLSALLRRIAASSASLSVKQSQPASPMHHRGSSCRTMRGRSSLPAREDGSTARAPRKKARCATSE
jgi:hypothetical protein